MIFKNVILILVFSIVLFGCANGQKVNILGEYRTGIGHSLWDGIVFRMKGVEAFDVDTYLKNNIDSTFFLQEGDSVNYFTGKWSMSNNCDTLFLTFYSHNDTTTNNFTEYYLIKKCGNSLIKYNRDKTCSGDRVVKWVEAFKKVRYETN